MTTDQTPLDRIDPCDLEGFRACLRHVVEREIRRAAAQIAIEIAREVYQRLAIAEAAAAAGQPQPGETKATLQ